MVTDEKPNDGCSAYYVEQFLRIAHQLIQNRNKLFEPYDITGKQAMVLSYIMFNKEKKLKQSDVVKEFQLKAPSINSLLVYLEDSGFIERKECDEDARAKIIVPTKKSMDIFEKLKKCATIQEEILLSGFNEKDIEQLKTILLRIRNNINNN